MGPYLVSALIFVQFSVEVVRAGLPSSCTPLNDIALSTYDVSTLYGTSKQLEPYGPRWLADGLRTRGAIPTQHFATNQIKSELPAPMRLMPYSATMSSDGIVYDAYTLDRWNQSTRSDAMMQQTPSAVNTPWEKVTSLGTNMKQLTSGPDGAPLSVFEGKSGIRVGIEGSSDPKLTDFGEMFANFIFKDLNGGSMEVPLTRGSPLLTHIFTDANPVLAPYCLSAINGDPTVFDCPVERSAMDGGSGYVVGSCSGGHLIITLHNTKPVDMDLIQWAANSASDWSNSHPMNTCDRKSCVQSEDGKRVDITVPATGDMSFAVNVVYRYVLPNDWINSPYTVSCLAKRNGDNFDLEVSAASSLKIEHGTASCDSNRNFDIELSFDTPLSGIGQVQFAVRNSQDWDYNHPMLTCTSTDCSLSSDMKTLTYRPAGIGYSDIKFAYNVIGVTVQPMDWEKNPYELTCGDVGVTPTDLPGSDPGLVVTPACNENFCIYEYCSGTGSMQLTLKMSESVSALDKVQFAVNSESGWDTSHPMINCNVGTCQLLDNGKTVVYTSDVAYDKGSFAINVIGKYILPPTDWETSPYKVYCDGRKTWDGDEVVTSAPGVPAEPGTPIGSWTSHRFVFELDEPGDELIAQTRKFVLYFSEEMKLSMYSGGVYAEPTSGGKFTGIMQMAYVGSTTKGDMSKATFMDDFTGVYSYKPATSFCVDETMGMGYISVEWNPCSFDLGSLNPNKDLLMSVMPHQEQVLSGKENLIETPYGFKGLVGGVWIMEEALPPASMEPETSVVNAIKNNPQQLQNILQGIEKDSQKHALDSICLYSNSYGVGKAIAMVARLASISRAFNTNHYQNLDNSIRNCLDLWLGVTDGLSEGEQFRYDTVYGGLFLSSTPAGQPLDPHANFGFPLFSDHHFHLGYFLYAMGYYAKYHPDWANDSNIRERIYAVARDVGNPSAVADPDFPVVRHKDWFMGMSWATGVIGGLRQAESSTEAINCYHGLAALGLALNDDTMKHIGQLTLATEIRSVREYWHVRAHNRHLFPDTIKEYGTIGQLAEDAIFYYTLNWPCDPHEFPMRHACLVGIQVIPITSISYLYMDQEWAESVKDVCMYSVDPWKAPGAELVDQSILRPVNQGWGAFCWATVSQYNSSLQAQAADYLNQLDTDQLVGGTGVASTLLFIYGST